MWLVAWSVAALAQDLVIDGTTVELSGVQSYDRVRVVNGGVLRVAAAGTLELSATSVVVDARSRIDGSGRGFQGVVSGAGAGAGGGATGPTSAGGAGHGGDGGDGFAADCTTIGGAGGGPAGAVDTIAERGAAGGAPTGSGVAGGAGGAAIRIDAAILDLRGRIEADGRDGPVSPTGEGAGGGAGGGITLVVDRLYCTGVLSARGGSGGAGSVGNGGGGAGGRIEQHTDGLAEACIVRVEPGRGGCGPVAAPGTFDALALDYDGDGQTVAAGDCDGADPDTLSGGAELCDGRDNDCDADVDDAATCAGFVRQNVNGRVWQFATTDRSWADARDACEDIGYALADIEDGAENSSFASNADQVENNARWWIGYNDIGVEGSFVWDGGAPWTYENFASNNPNGGDCVRFNGNNQWTDENCTEGQNYACEICEGSDRWYPDADGDGFGDRTDPVRTCLPEAGQTDDATDCNDADAGDSPIAAPDACNGIDDDCDGLGDEGCTCFAETFDGHDYELCTSVTTWDGARAVCERKGKTLVTIDDDAENIWLGDEIDALSSSPWWIGLSDRATGGSFGWTFGGTSYEAFGGAEPDGSGDCVALNATGAGDTEWADEACTEERRFVCEEIAGCTPVIRYRDADGDGFGSDTDTVLACKLPSGFRDSGGDCEDGDDGVFPGADEILVDGIDQDCDGGDRCHLDGDGDGSGVAAGTDSADLSCTGPGESETTDDCDDGDDGVFPGAPETCGDGTDSDCNGAGGPTSDEDGDGLPWEVEGPLGGDDCTDDTDGDGVVDVVEIIVGDTDDDGTADLADPDDDDDTLPTLFEGTGDDECVGLPDGVPNHLDLDSDGDGVLDFDEGSFDTDADDIPDFLDCTNECATDDDGDGIEVCDETRLGTDPQRADTDGDGRGDLAEVVDVAAPKNTDGDAFIDALDPDDDGDLVDTVREDRDGDGDPGNDDTDGDDLPDCLDPDDDGDGASTRDEDRDDDGDPATDDTDGDAIPDYLDDRDWDGPAGDPDGDGLANQLEAGLGSDPNDFDTDDDGLLDGDELGGGDAPRDTDDDDLPDLLDPDDDGDGVPTLDEGQFDVDGDDLPNHLDPDSDDDGLADGADGTGDADCDARIDRYDAVDDARCGALVDGRESYERSGCGCRTTSGGLGWWFAAMILVWRRSRARGSGAGVC